MNQRIIFSAILLFLCFLSAPLWAQDDCSSFLVSKGASKDGSVMITYTCDGEFLSKLEYIPAQDHKPGEYIETRGRRDQIRGKVKQVPHTYAVVGLMNEFQLAIGETTFGGRCAPSLNLSPDFQRGVEGTEPYPLWIKPDKKLSVHDVMSVMRDHYEGTEFDMTKGVDAGPFGCPVRHRGLTWEVDGIKYSWERPISTQQTAFSFISQSRGWLPDGIGGVYWYGFDDTYTTCYVPFYCCIQDIPEPFTRGDLQKFSWDSGWWVFNFVANFANLKYSYMVKDIQKVQSALEGRILSLQPVIEKTALELAEADPELMVEYLTSYSVSQGEMVIRRWIELGEYLITKYNDGYVKDENGRPRGLGYSSEWLKTVLKSKPKQFKLPAWGEDKKDGRLH